MLFFNLKIIKVVRFCSDETYSSNFDFNQCVQMSSTSSFDCSQSFQKSAFSCSETNRTNRFESATIPYNLVTSFSLNLKPGYNIFTNFENILMKPGYVLIVETTSPGPLIDLDQSATGLSDYKISPFESVNGKFRINNIITPLNKISSISHKYSIQNNYLVSVTIKNRLNSTESFLLSQNVMVYESVRDLMVSTIAGNLVCFKDKDCALMATVSTGKELTYNWTIDGIEFSTAETQITHQFTIVGQTFINLIAYNLLSSQNITVMISVTDRLEGLYFKAGNEAKSASALGKQANFLFMLEAGANYECTVNFGNSQLIKFSDEVYNLNNTIISHVYSEEKTYQVSITCANQVNSLNLQFNHQVEQELKGLKLKNNVALVNRQFSIEFTLDSGSAISQSLLLFNNQEEPITFNLLNGRGLVHQGVAFSTRFPVYIMVKNLVSSLELNATFEISSPIINPKFTVAPPGDISANKYTFPQENYFDISMDSGSNVRIEINADLDGEILLNGINLIDIQTTGEWSTVTNSPSNTYRISYNYINPGDFLIKVRLSNFLGNFIITKQISIISKVDGLLPAVADLNPNNYVLFERTSETKGKGIADFVFQSEGDSKAGSHASIIFWPGDLINSTNGPFLFKMDFNRNISTTAIQYTYNETGTYLAKFLVYNDRGSKSFNLQINVELGIFGFYIDVLPRSVAPNDPYTVSAYMIQGENVDYTLKVNDVIVENFQRTGKVDQNLISNKIKKLIEKN